MSGVRLEHDSADLARLTGFFSNLIGADTSPMMDEVGAHVVSRTVGRLHDQVDIHGQPLEPSRRAKDEGGKTLIDHGHLRDSYTHNVTNGGDSVEIGSNMVYAAIHHYGGKIVPKTAGALHFQIGDRHIIVKSVTMPARPVLGIDEQDEDDLRDITGAFIDGLVA